MKITIAGDLGSGKSTVNKIISEKYNLQSTSTGDFMRKLAAKRNISLLELSKIAETDKSIDEEIDAYQVKFGKENDNFILDARLGWHFIPDSVKVYLTIDDDEAARRIFNDKRVSEDTNSIEEIKAGRIRRKASERKRYKEYYNLDYDAKDNFDLIIDTTATPAEIVAQKIIDFASKKQ